MSLTREDLETGRMRRLWSECANGPRPLTDEELEASIARVLARACPGWTPKDWEALNAVYWKEYE